MLLCKMCTVKWGLSHAKKSLFFLSTVRKNTCFEIGYLRLFSINKKYKQVNDSNQSFSMPVFLHDDTKNILSGPLLPKFSRGIFSYEYTKSDIIEGVISPNSVLHDFRKKQMTS